ncbi:flagellar basal body-associated protein FliL [Alteromonas sp. D210916BOD_24]|uniref:flagellar basal body-associated protein FliL n=1 Tax=Alteromonas sp. D210916BOD_24 TaxID=3157618 RepID=UPI00399D266A
MLKSLFLRCFLITVVVLSNAGTASAQERANFAYLGIEPEIVTNYISESAKKLGYVRVSVELMIYDVSLLEVAEHHMPLLRSTAIEIFGQQPEEKVKSLTGREEIRQAILKALQEHMKQETGGEVIKNVIFTKYLYQGG